MVGGRSAQPDTLQRSGLLSVSAARHKGRTASRGCPDRLAFHPGVSATLLVIPAEIRRQSYRGDSSASALKAKIEAGERDISERQPTGEKVTDGAAPIPGILTRSSGGCLAQPRFLSGHCHPTLPKCHHQALRDLFHPGSWLVSRRTSVLPCVTAMAFWNTA